MSWSWFKEVLVTLAELILAIGQVIWQWLCGWVPVLLVVDLLGHSFAVLFALLPGIIIPYYTLPGSFLAVTSHDKNVAFALLGVFLFVLVMTAGPLAQMWLCDAEVSASASPALSAHLLAKGLRPNACDRCSPSPRDLEEGRAMIHLDRMYHCVDNSGKELGCIPVLDHYCWWLWVPVALPTIKSYLLFMVWIVVFQTVSLGILAWPLAISAWHSTAWLYVFIAACFPYMLVLVLAAPIRKQWRRLACMDSPGKEYAQYIRHRPAPAFPMYVKRSDGTYAHRLMSDNPWDKGTMLNLRSDTQASGAFTFAMAGIPLQTLDPARHRRGFSSED
uniref:Dhhc zinc finger domain-containing protein n=1 Tax=Colletotrichum fructicola (strain Nara gc5) TaxID=1213859 RepID=L2FIR1_COLFN